MDIDKIIANNRRIAFLRGNPHIYGELLRGYVRGEDLSREKERYAELKLKESTLTFEEFDELNKLSMLLCCYNDARRRS